MYKDKDKQREADKSRQQRRRDVIKAKGVTNTGCDGQGVTEQRTGIESMIKPKPELTAQGNVRVSKPGDADYEPQCETTRAFIEGRDKRPETAKRGKDIKVFADPKDLPPLTQARILLSKHGAHCSPSLVCSIPGSTVIGKPGDADYNGVCTEAWRAERGR